jgi:hypothetical protein
VVVGPLGEVGRLLGLLGIAVGARGLRVIAGLERDLVQSRKVVGERIAFAASSETDEKEGSDPLI